MKQIIQIILFISLLFCQNEDLPDDRAEWLFTNPNNIDLLDGGKSKILKSEFSKMLTDFKKEISEKKLYIFEKDERPKVTGSKVDTDLLKSFRGQGVDYESALAMSRVSTVTMTTKTVYKEFKVAKKLDTKIPEWSEILKYYGGYSGIASAGIKKSDLERFRITKYIQKISLIGGTRCSAIIQTKGEKDYGLKFYKISNTTSEIEGTTNLFDFTISDIYYIAQNNKEMTLREFRFLDLDIVHNESLISINNKVIGIAKKYFDTIELMIDDLIPMDYYNNLIPERKIIADGQNKLAFQMKSESERLIKIKPLTDEYSFLLSIFLIEEMARRQLFGGIEIDGRDRDRIKSPREHNSDYFQVLKERNGIKMKKKAKGNIAAKPDEQLWWKESYHLSIAYAILNNLPTYGLGCKHYGYDPSKNQNMMKLMYSSVRVIKMLPIDRNYKYSLIKDCEIKGVEEWPIDQKIMEVYNILKKIENIDFYWSMVVDFYDKKSINELYLSDVRLAKLRAMDSKDRKVEKWVAKAKHQFAQAKGTYNEQNYTRSFQLSYDDFTKRLQELNSE